MVVITRAAQAQLEALESHYTSTCRDRAMILLHEAVTKAISRIDRESGPFFAAPRPYRDLADLNWRWLKQGRYWIGFVAAQNGYAVMGIFFDTADIPRRI